MNGIDMNVNVESKDSKSSFKDSEDTVVRSELQRAAERQPRARIPFGVPRVKTSVLGNIPGYEVSWINDIGSRIQMALMGGYEFISPSEIDLAVGASGVTPDSSDLGDKISMIVGTLDNGNSLRAYLMKIPIEYKEENRAYFAEQRNKRLMSIQRRQSEVSGSKFYSADGSNPFSGNDKSPLVFTKK
jgi:hypothetical protein